MTATVPQLDEYSVSRLRRLTLATGTLEPLLVSGGVPKSLEGDLLDVIAEIRDEAEAVLRQVRSGSVDD